MHSTQQQKESTFVSDQIHDTEAPPVITIDDYERDAVGQFTYLGSTITDNLSLDAEAASTLARLTAPVWTTPKLSVKTNMAAYNAGVTSTLLYAARCGLHMPGRRVGPPHSI